MVNGIRTGVKGCSLKFCVGSWVQQTPEESQRTYQLKHCENNNKNEDNIPKTLYDKKSNRSIGKLLDRSVLAMTLNCVWWWVSSSGGCRVLLHSQDNFDLWVKYLFFNICICWDGMLKKNLLNDYTKNINFQRIRFPYIKLWNNPNR